MNRPEWGPWEVDTEAYTPTFRLRDFNVALETCVSPAEILDWICEIRDQVWADDKCLAGFMRAISAVLGLQALF
jgi:hypothetical protein